MFEMVRYGKIPSVQRDRWVFPLDFVSGFLSRIWRLSLTANDAELPVSSGTSRYSTAKSAGVALDHSYLSMRRAP